MNNIKGKMMALKTLEVVHVKLLREACGRFGGDWTSKKRQLLQSAAAMSISKVNVLIEYHDCLLFLLAYPETKELFDLATRELDRAADMARNIFVAGGDRKRAQLIGTGIAFTPVNVAFGFDLVEWLVDKYPEQVSIFECSADKQTVKELLLLLLPKAEQEGYEKKDYSFLRFIQFAKGKSRLSDLQWFIQLIGRKKIAPTLRDHLYDALKIYVTWLPDKESPSRTYARSLPRKIYFHSTELKKQWNPGKIIGEPIGKPLKISPEEKSQLVVTSRGILGMLQRETDPVTYADPEAVAYFDMGRGIDIALYPMVAERRLPFDAYIGYTAFKNRLPIAYGGGWIFQQRCKIGVNVLAPYRGGESAYIFLQVLRLYHHHYHINRFVVEPYQIGYKNSEGLKSGAFWFYYRMGFVPENEGLKELAAREYNLIKQDKGYRSSLAVLKKLSTSNMELIMDQKGYHHTDVLLISEAITRMIKDRFEGNRQRAEVESLAVALNLFGMKTGKELPLSLVESIRNFALLLQLFPATVEWNKEDKLALYKLVFLKGCGSESEYVRHFQKHRKLNEAIVNYFAS